MKRQKGMALATMVVIALAAGCSTVGNGKIDPGGVEILDLSAVDIDVEWVSEDGRAFKVVNDANGVDLQGTFIEPKTGLVFTLGEGIGSVVIRDPATGLQTTIVPKPSGASPTP